MTPLNRHIISSLSWNTSFDRKERASELQARLSTWSNIRLQQELNAVFDSLCPPGQTWKINAIELDLGVIEYNQLEAELSLRVRKQLLEKLNDMISHPGSGENAEIEISDENSSELMLLESFLLTGVMPWNLSFTQEPVNSMMAAQLEQNRINAIEMIRSVGVVHDKVRKRIAWQFTEPVFGKIIEGLEPNNHKEISAFSDKMIALQEKEPVVKSSIADLRKNIRHWILNYIFSERGTLFNKVAFVKSTLRQMADHHNIRYEELLDLVSDAVRQVQEAAGFPGDFIRTLNIVAEESRAVKNKEKIIFEQEADHWQKLELLLRDVSLNRPGLNYAEFNDLVVSLGRKDRSRLADMVRTIIHGTNFPDKVVALNESSLEIIFRALCPAAPGIFLESIYLLQSLAKKIIGENKTVWKAALKFAFENKIAVTDNAVFISYCITALAKETGVAPEQFFMQLINTPLPPAVKTIAALQIYSDLNKLFTEERKTALVPSATQQLHVLIEKINRAITSGEDRETFLLLRKKFLKLVQLHPESVTGMLVAYPQKEMLNKVLPFLLSTEIIRVLAGNLNHELKLVLTQVKHAADTLKKKSGASKLTEILLQHSEIWTLEAVIIHRQMDPAKVLEYILRKLLQKSEAGQFVLFCTVLTGYADAVTKPVTEKFMRIATEKASDKDIAAQVDLLTTDEKKQMTEELLRTLNEKTGDENSATPEDLLTSDEKKRMIAEYKSLLLSHIKNISGNAIEKQLEELYRKCLLDHARYAGNITAFRKAFHTAVFYSFRLPEKIRLAEEQKNKIKLATPKSYTLQNGEVVTLREIFDMIAACLEDGFTVLEKDGKKYELKELLDLGLELKPSEIRKIISRLSLSGPGWKALKAAGSFQHVSLWIMSDLHGEMNAAMEAIRMLHDMVVLVIPGNAADKMLDEFWTEMWAVVSAGTWSREELKKLIRRSFTKIAAEFEIGSAEFITEMKNKNVKISSALRDDLISCFPAFAALPENNAGIPADRRLAEFESKGLLDNLVEHLVLQKRVPSWAGGTSEEEVKALLREIIIHHPVKFLQVMKREIIPEPQLRWLSDAIDFKELTLSIGYLSREKQPVLSILAEFHAALGKISVNGISTAALQEILFKKLMKAWTSNNWKIIAVENIWNEFVWDVCMKFGIPKKDLLRDLKKASALFPPAIKIALEQLVNQDMKSGNNSEKQKPVIKKKQMTLPKNPSKKTTAGGIAVRNAGIVILNTYVQMLFERLGLVKEKKFVTPEAQDDAVHYLQYVVTGLTRTEESFLPLNKIMCGLPLDHPVKDGITITEEQKNLVDGLIRAAIAHWPVIGDTSIEGFRGNWLVREGMLAEHEDKWELIVEKRAYDILLNKSPYSFSIIKYPWMEKPLHVTWPY